jgi:DNA-binding response OmpR family regulator
MKNEDKKTILIVDDQPDNLHVLIDYLAEYGFSIFVAQSGEEMLQRIERIQPDMILLDVMMPGIDGFETCRRLKENTTVKGIPVIFMTALTDTVDKVKGFETGGVDYVTKPLQHEEVLARINTHLTIRNLQQQLQAQNILLEQQNERFRGLSEATFEGIIIYDNRQIIEVNQAALQMFGYERSELIGNNVLDLLTPESRKALLQHINTG